LLNTIKMANIVAIFFCLLYYHFMRVVAGKYRGKILKDFELESTKPTTDRVKESIFNLIQFDVNGAVVLDLFAGTGALGIESISRGAKTTYFVDANPKAIEIITSNLNSIDGEYFVEKIDFQSYLKNTKNKFDIIFLDPPYKTDLGLKAINMIIENNLLKDEGIIIFETSEENNFELAYQGFDIKKKKYGKIIVFKMVKI